MVDLDQSYGRPLAPLLSAARLQSQAPCNSVPNPAQASGGWEPADRGATDQQPINQQPTDQQAIVAGWLIEGAAAHPEGRKIQAPRRRFLQIGTGQWCGAPYATRFPRRSTAIAYAREFGLLVEPLVQIVRYPDDAGEIANQRVSKSSHPMESTPIPSPTTRAVRLR